MHKGRQYYVTTADLVGSRNVLAGVEGLRGYRTKFHVVVGRACHIHRLMANTEKPTLRIRAKMYFMGHLRLVADHAVLLLAGQNHLDRPTRDMGSHADQDFMRPYKGFGTEPSARVRGNNANVRTVDSERRRQGVLHGRKMLHRVVHGEPLPLPDCENGARLHRIAMTGGLRIFAACAESRTRNRPSGVTLVEFECIRFRIITLLWSNVCGGRGVRYDEWVPFIAHAYDSSARFSCLQTLCQHHGDRLSLVDDFVRLHGDESRRKRRHTDFFQLSMHSRHVGRLQHADHSDSCQGSGRLYRDDTSCWNRRIDEHRMELGLAVSIARIERGASYLDGAVMPGNGLTQIAHHVLAAVSMVRNTALRAITTL